MGHWVDRDISETCDVCGGHNTVQKANGSHDRTLKEKNPMGGGFHVRGVLTHCENCGRIKEKNLLLTDKEKKEFDEEKGRFSD